jgi:hypothetical protein
MLRDMQKGSKPGAVSTVSMATYFLSTFVILEAMDLVIGMGVEELGFVGFQFSYSFYVVFRTEHD